MAFWRMLKQGYDHFEITRQAPKVDVCDRRYVFDAQSSGNFSPTEQCPAYSVPQEIASAVYNKERQDEAQFAGGERSSESCKATAVSPSSRATASFAAERVGCCRKSSVMSRSVRSPLPLGMGAVTGCTYF
jgi:murein L,D-transpeptidase YafK